MRRWIRNIFQGNGRRDRSPSPPQPPPRRESRPNSRIWEEMMQTIIASYSNQPTRRASPRVNDMELDQPANPENHDNDSSGYSTSDSEREDEDVTGGWEQTVHQHSPPAAQPESSAITHPQRYTGSSGEITQDHLVLLNYPVYPWYARLDKRLASYKNWPPSNSHKPSELARAGFWYGGRSDQITCYYCGLSLYKLLPSDNVVAEHQKYFPDCIYIRISTQLPPKTDLEETAVTKEEDNLSSTTIVNEQRTEKEEDSTICRVCLQNTCNLAFVPCGHLACSECACLLKKCHICRAKLSSAMKIYF